MIHVLQFTTKMQFLKENRNDHLIEVLFGYNFCDLYDETRAAHSTISKPIMSVSTNQSLIFGQSS